MKRKILVILFVLFAIAAIGLWAVYGKFVRPGTRFLGESKVLFLPTGTDMAGLTKVLEVDSFISDPAIFNLLANRKNFRVLKPGRFLVPRGESMNSLINRLKSGNTEPVMVTFNMVTSLSQVAGRVSEYLEGDSVTFARYLTNPELSADYGFLPETFTAMFIPDTYEMVWTSGPQELVERMKVEYDRFWTIERKALAEKLGLSPVQISTLASIVKAETAQTDEASRIAGVYLNRLRIGMPLQADPTLKFALNDPDIKRLLNEDKLVDSPYNTYMHSGLPPGPINLPERTYLEAALKAEKHNYLYLCAKADFSGYHNFSRSLDQHESFAALYRRALNKRRIYR